MTPDAKGGFECTTTSAVRQGRRNARAKLRHWPIEFLGGFAQDVPNFRSHTVSVALGQAPEENVTTILEITHCMDSVSFGLFLLFESNKQPIDLLRSHSPLVGGSNHRSTIFPAG